MSVSTIVVAQKNIARYGLSMLLTFGNIGNILTIVIFFRGAKRRLNSCSMYLLSACISNWIVINTALVSNIVGIDHIDPQNTSNFICKLRWSSVHALLMLSRSFMVVACIDRWAFCSQDVHFRSFSQPRIAARMIIALIIIWTILPIHMAIFFNNASGRCAPQPGIYALCYAIYSVVVIGVLPLFLMALFSFLALNSLRKIRSRVSPMIINQHNVLIHKRDRDLMAMLFAEVFIYCLTTIPYPINLIYSVTTTYIGIQKDSMRLAIESLISYIISPLLNFMYCCVQFYVYSFSSRRFRSEFLNLIRCRPISVETAVLTRQSYTRAIRPNDLNNSMHQ